MNRSRFLFTLDMTTLFVLGILWSPLCAKDVSFPKESPEIVFTIPDDFNVKWKEKDLLAFAKGEWGYILSTSQLDTGKTLQERLTLGHLRVLQATKDAAQDFKILSQETITVKGVSYQVTYVRVKINNNDVTSAFLSFSPDGHHVYQLVEVYDVLTHLRSEETFRILGSLKVLSSSKQGKRKGR